MKTAGERNNKGEKFSGFFKGLERIGNKLPHPVWIFVFLIFVTLIASWVFSSMGVSVKYLAVQGKEVVEQTASVVNLLSKKEFPKLFSDFTANILSNAVIGNVITISMCMMIAESTGFFDAFFRKVLLGAPKVLITFILAFVGVNANIAGDAGNVLAATLGGVVFQAIGRNPVIGVITGFSAASAGYTANLMIANQDVTLSATTTAVTKILGFADFHPLINWYFMAFSTIILAIVCTIVSEKIVTPLIGDYKILGDASGIEKHKVSPEEARGLRTSGIAMLVYLAMILVVTVPSNGLLRNSNGTLIPKSPFISSIVVIVAIMFAVLGTSYGFGSGKIKSWNDIPQLMKKGISRVASMILVLAWVAQFVAIFGRSNLATIVSVKGQQFLEAINLQGLPLLLVFIVVVIFMDLFMTSGSNKFFILAPIFIPMFARMGINPAITQVAYRIGDTVANPLSPLGSTLPVAIALVEEYWDKNRKDRPGLGTVISYNLPFSISFLITLVVIFVIFYAFNLPMGPAIPEMSALIK
ncbi:MAG TPA: AbgT family transporter [Bacillota bacterium]|nr:AbgT family transporter [Bacillota bacterium]HOH10105.1 AbgT family transporter [Bacillota bacterium]HOY88511.1 AbgT family transporter [Bacillota bacterium]HPI01129.1 AbgT family transporter [Bacillota bacterium]HPM62906.1 AbgT family transporter [Bacillota bacterium]